jgi:tRNA(Ile)-lysidine synthase
VSFSPAKLLETLRRLPKPRRYRVGLSGGLDSTVLLTACAAIRAELGELDAIHVNHNLQPDAEAWAQRCEKLCAGLGVPLTGMGVMIDPFPGASFEAAAREARYDVFRDLIQSGDMLLLAQHADDQLETFLLQALRGAGVRGLSAMPECVEWQGGHLARPLLKEHRSGLETWARAQGLSWIEDPSNADTRLDRNYLRHELLPRLKARWPAAADTISRAAAHCAEAEASLSALAAEDWARLGSGLTLPVAALDTLSEVRARQLLRHWIGLRGLPLPSAHKLAEILSQARAGEDRNPCIDWDGAEVRRYGGQLHALEPLAPAPEGFRLHPGHFEELGDGLGSLGLVPSTGEGIRAALCGPEGLRVTFREGGESCRPAGRAHGRPLKKWLQELHVLPWLRERLPLIYSGERAGEELLAVAGLFACEPHAAKAGEAGLRIEWRDHPPLH